MHKNVVFDDLTELKSINLHNVTAVYNPTLCEEMYQAVKVPCMHTFLDLPKVTTIQMASYDGVESKEIRNVV